MVVDSDEGRERTAEEWRNPLAANGFALPIGRGLPLDMAVLVARATAV